MAHRRGETLGQEGRYRRTPSSPTTVNKGASATSGNETDQGSMAQDQESMMQPAELLSMGPTGEWSMMIAHKIERSVFIHVISTLDQS